MRHSLGDLGVVVYSRLIRLCLHMRDHYMLLKKLAKKNFKIIDLNNSRHLIRAESNGTNQWGL